MGKDIIGVEGTGKGVGSASNSISDMSEGVRAVRGPNKIAI